MKTTVLPVLPFTTENPRFVWSVGAYREPFPDMPDLAGLTLWDRQESKSVVTVHGQYAQLFCLETTRRASDAPFSALETWINGVSNLSLKSEGIVPTRSV